ncbi:MULTISPECIES: SigE family RNA polymerase sigma factor [unclassified Isoptericola]|uniref:SigE family RNA polymerase sigma factor n=1 Tax=unclassified Isoptericola TaxID=2623355 RepID=UPI003662B249
MTATHDADAAAWHDEAHVDVQVTHQSRNAEFAAFMAASVDPLHRTAYLLCGDRHRAEELVQQALERTYRSWHRAREGDPLAYARRTLANLRIDTWRSTRREVLADHDDLTAAAGRTDGPDGTHAVDDRDAVVRALLLLPLRQRRVVVLRHLVGLSEEEVSRELGIPRGTVKSTASRGLSRLRAALDLDALGGPR